MTPPLGNKKKEDCLRNSINKYSPKISFESWKENYPMEYASHMDAMEEYASTVAKEAVEEHKKKIEKVFEEAGGTVSDHYLKIKGLI